MAEEGDSGEKTEQPTPRRTSEARKEGQVGVSTDFSSVVGLIAAYLALQYVAPSLWDDLKIVVSASFSSSYSSEPITVEVLRDQTIHVLYLLVPELLIIMFIAAFFGAGVTLIQTNFLWAPKLFNPRLSYLNPITGFKRIFSLNNFVHTAKAIVKLLIICPIAYFAFFNLFPSFVGLMDVHVQSLLAFTAKAADYIFWKIISCLLILAILDLVWQKWRTNQKLKMSKQEVKDEKKSVEGDEGTRRRILAIGLRRARDRMMQSVKTADVVVTNPTHIAVALSYSLEPGSAPRVVAKGQGFIAEQIKKIAHEHGVPVIERKPLARALYKMVEVGQEIPYELFKAVAELLAYVYRIKGKIPAKARAAISKKQKDAR